MRFKMALFALFISITPTFVLAADPIAKVAIVDVQRIMRESLAAKDLQQQLEKKKNEFQSEITKHEQQLQKEDKALAEERSVLSADAFEKKRNAFKTKVEDVQRKVNTRKTQLEAGYANAINQIQIKVLAIVDSIAKEKSYTLIVPSSQVLYADPTMNISENVLKQLDKQLAKVSLSVPEKEEEKKKEDKKS